MCARSGGLEIVYKGEEMRGVEVGLGGGGGGGGGAVRGRLERDSLGYGAVSYTHLTLPPILRVFISVFFVSSNNILINTCTSPYTWLYRNQNRYTMSNRYYNSIYSDLSNLI